MKWKFKKEDKNTTGQDRTENERKGKERKGKGREKER